MTAIDDAIQAELIPDGRVVTEWIIFACSQSIDDDESQGGYQAAYRPGMLPHHVGGLIEQGIDMLDSRERSDFDE